MTGCHGWGVESECRVMRSFAVCLAVCLAACLGACLVLAAPAIAQESPDAAEPAPEIDWSRVNLDELSLMLALPSQGGEWRVPGRDNAATWNRTENKNGSANVVQKQNWASGIATNVGVDSVGTPPNYVPQPWALPGSDQTPGSGAGWASAAIPGVGPIGQTTLDARLDPNSDQRRFGARFEKSMPLNEQLSVTLQNGYGVSQPLASQTIAGTPPPAQVFESEQLAKLNMLNFGTSLFAATKHNSVEDRRLNSFGAEQNLFGGLSLSGAVSDNATGGHDRSLTARFRRTW